MTKAEHRARHKLLHEQMDELIADYLAHHRGKLLSNTTLMELMQWSHRQTVDPEDISGQEEAHERERTSPIPSRCPNPNCRIRHFSWEGDQVACKCGTTYAISENLCE
jgi:hypothetical protein